MITAAALTVPHLQLAVTSASQPCRAASTTVAVTCYYAAKVTIYSCRNRAVSGIQDGVKITVDGKSLVRECPAGRRTQ
jgi:hypothetical protein